MLKERALLVMGQGIAAVNHHRGQHLADFLAGKFAELDVVSFTKMYDGPGTDPLLRKGLIGLRDTIWNPVKRTRHRNINELAVRVPRMPSLFDHLFRDYWSYASVRKHLKASYDLCILGDPRAAFIALRLKRLGRVGLFVYDDWDYFPGEFPSGSIVRSIIAHKELICIRAADCVTSVSSGLERLRREQGAQRTAVARNGVDLVHFEIATRRKAHAPTLLYVGTLAEAWGADLPIIALPTIRRQIPNARYVLVGGGPDQARLSALANGLHLSDCVSFLGRQSYEALPSIMAEADIGIATSRDTDFRRFACPLKICEYMAAGLPVIATKVGEGMSIVEEAGAGETVHFSADDFAGAAVSLLASQDKYNRASANARRFAREHDWNRILDRQLAFIESTVEPQVAQAR